MLILGFFGVGKTTLARQNEKVADLTDLGSPSLSLLQDTVAKYDIVLADPTWEQVFLESGEDFIVVVPSLDRKEEFLTNFKERNGKGLGGGNDGFRELIGKHWEWWINHLLSIPSQGQIVLERGEFLSHLLLRSIFAGIRGI